MRYVLLNFGEQQVMPGMKQPRRGDVLAVSIADCYPLLFWGPWKRRDRCRTRRLAWNKWVVLPKTRLMQWKGPGASRNKIRVAIGQNFTTKLWSGGHEVIDQFAANGFPENCWDMANTLTLTKCNIFVLTSSSILPQTSGPWTAAPLKVIFLATAATKGLTGRMWGGNKPLMKRWSNITCVFIDQQLSCCTTKRHVFSIRLIKPAWILRHRVLRNWSKIILQPVLTANGWAWILDQFFNLSYAKQRPPHQLPLLAKRRRVSG